MEKLLIIDSNSLINRAYYGVRFLSAPDGTPTNAIYGFLMTLFKIIDEQKPDYIMAAFDLKAPTFRHKMYKEYKAQRKPMPDELAVQMPIAKEILDKMGIMRLEMEGYEADDIIGTISAECTTRDIKCLIATGDKDDLQLANSHTSILLTTTRSGVTDTVEYTPETVFERYHVTPEEFIDVKALMGDASDNIPGVAGIGEKTAMALIAEYKSIENIYENFDSHGFTGAKERKLREGKDMAYMSKKLATIDRNVPICADFDAAKGGISAGGELYSILSRLGLTTIIKRLDFSKEDAKAADIKSPIEGCGFCAISDKSELAALCDKILAAKECSIIFSIKNNELERIGIGFDGCGYAVLVYKIGYDETIETMKPLLEDEAVKKLCFAVKDAIVKLAPKLHFRGISYDAAIAAYLINPARSQYTPGSLCAEYFGINPIDSAEKGQISLFDDEEEDIGKNIADEALLIKSLYEKTLQKLREASQERLYFDVELPLVEVLADMQINGMYVDRQRLHEFGNMLAARIDELTASIYSMAGEEFNINSPKQLGEVLFERMQIDQKRKKKTKNGYSTSADVLEALKDSHPIVGAVLEYRRYAKLKSTYCDGLEAVISPETGRIHSVFNQTVTVTGRISSTEPNMQNIPARTELGREIRKVFVAGDGKVFVDADYSQIELRVLAAIADDKQMKQAFSEGADIHTETASQILGIPADEITKQQRSSAKAINFGIVYGMSDFSLAKDLHISVKEAKNYIDSYLRHYSGVRAYMERIKEEAKRDGYVKTMMNRIRYIPELKSSNYNMRMFGERVALNTPIQGTAADIIKLAMVRVHKRLEKENLKSKLVLQVHDELIIEAEQEEEQEVRKILREEMENAVDIGVALPVEMESGRSWYDCK